MKKLLIGSTLAVISLASVQASGEESGNCKVLRLANADTPCVVMPFPGSERRGVWFTLELAERNRVAFVKVPLLERSLQLSEGVTAALTTLVGLHERTEGKLTEENGELRGKVDAVTRKYESCQGTSFWKSPALWYGLGIGSGILGSIAVGTLVKEIKL